MMVVRRDAIMGDMFQMGKSRRVTRHKKHRRGSGLGAGSIVGAGSVAGAYTGPFLSST